MSQKSEMDYVTSGYNFGELDGSFIFIKFKNYKSIENEEDNFEF